jgi:hypothetical protein
MGSPLVKGRCPRAGKNANAPWVRDRCPGASGISKWLWRPSGFGSGIMLQPLVPRIPQKCPGYHFCGRIPRTPGIHNHPFPPPSGGVANTCNQSFYEPAIFVDTAMPSNLRRNLAILVTIFPPTAVRRSAHTLVYWTPLCLV